MVSVNKIPGLTHYIKLQTTMVRRMMWPYSFDNDDLFRWRATILFSILFSGLILGTVAFVSAIVAITKEGVWGVAIADVIGLTFAFSLLMVPKIRFEIRALITCLLFFLIGAVVIVAIGPQLGGPAWLFAFSVLSGVLLGRLAAFGAIALNAFFLIVFCFLVLNGHFQYNTPYFSTPSDMVASVINFLVANGITAISVTALINGIFELYNEKKQLTKELQVKNLVFESAITANSASDAEGILTSINKTFLTLWGYDRKEDVLGKPITQFFKYEHEAVEIITSLDETGVWEGEFTALRLDSSTFAAYGLATTIDSLSEGITGYQSSVIDISDRKKAEKDKIQAQKNAAENEKLALVGQIAGKMAHDFNNVLGIIMGHSELALLTSKDLKIKKTFELIFNQTLRGKNLTKNLIAFAKSAEPKQEFFYINKKIDYVLSLLKTDLDGIDIIKENWEALQVLADPGMIEHSIVNLIQNSIHATSLTKNPQIIIRIYSLEKIVAFDIEDNGCGIPEEYINNIYEPSFSLKGGQDVHGRYKIGIKGTGYGMANVKKSIELHKGHVQTESVVDNGTKVTVTLPMIEKKLTTEEVLEVQKSKNYPEKYILLVEDEPAIAEVQYQILTQTPNNHDVDIASNGQAAIDMLDKNEYDLISLDYMLPGEINGIDVYHYIRKSDTSIPILFISGNIEFLESIKMLKQKDPYLSYLSKPCLNVDYLNGLNKLFGKLNI